MLLNYWKKEVFGSVDSELFTETLNLLYSQGTFSLLDFTTVSSVHVAVWVQGNCCGLSKLGMNWINVWKDWISWSCDMNHWDPQHHNELCFVFESIVESLNVVSRAFYRVCLMWVMKSQDGATTWKSYMLMLEKVLKFGLSQEEKHIISIKMLNCKNPLFYQKMETLQSLTYFLLMIFGNTMSESYEY